MLLHAKGFQSEHFKIRIFKYADFSLAVRTKDTIERGGLQLIVETEVNGDSKSTNERGVLPWLVPWACRTDTRDFRSALVAQVSPVKNIFFLTIHFFNSFVPIAQQVGHWQAAKLGRLSLSMCLWCALRRL